MKVTETKLAGCYLVEPELFEDERGYLTEAFNAKRFHRVVDADTHFVQDNQSFSKHGVVRGLHYQVGVHAQAKLIRVLQGTIWDVAIDLRGASTTFKQHFGVELSYENKKQLFIPRGFAHGFVVLSDTAEVCYKCDNYYNKEAEGGIAFNDPDFDIDWKLPPRSLILSEKDRMLPNFDKAIL